MYCKSYLQSPANLSFSADDRTKAQIESAKTRFRIHSIIYNKVTKGCRKRDRVKFRAARVSPWAAREVFTDKMPTHGLWIQPLGKFRSPLLTHIFRLHKLSIVKNVRWSPVQSFVHHLHIFCAVYLSLLFEKCTQFFFLLSVYSREYVEA